MSDHEYDAISTPVGRHARSSHRDVRYPSRCKGCWCCDKIYLFPRAPQRSNLFALLGCFCRGWWRPLHPFRSSSSNRCRRGRAMIITCTFYTTPLFGMLWTAIARYRRSLRRTPPTGRWQFAGTDLCFPRMWSTGCGTTVSDQEQTVNMSHRRNSIRTPDTPVTRSI